MQVHEIALSSTDLSFKSNFKVLFMKLVWIILVWKQFDLPMPDKMQSNFSLSEIILCITWDEH